jgi:hypothetical protein
MDTLDPRAQAKTYFGDIPLDLTEFKGNRYALF